MARQNRRSMAGQARQTRRRAGPIPSVGPPILRTRAAMVNPSSQRSGRLVLPKAHIEVAKVGAGHMPFEIFRLHIQCEDIGQEGVQGCNDLCCAVAIVDAPKRSAIAVFHSSRSCPHLDNFQPLVGEPFLAGVPPHQGSSAAQLAAGAPHRGGRQGEAARLPIVAIGCGLGLRLRRSKSPDASLHPHGRRKSGRLALGARRIASGWRISQACLAGSR